MSPAELEAVRRCVDCGTPIDLQSHDSEGPHWKRCADVRLAQERAAKTTLSRELGDAVARAVRAEAERGAALSELRAVTKLVRDLARSVEEDDRHDEEEEALCKWLDAYDVARKAGG